jgi:class 3 adenylate cyclase/tetratricopeptide (TPR) repeat protein
MAACARCGVTLPEGARFCPSCATPVAERPEPAEERKVATVLFADLVGSTELGGSQDPERTRVLLDRFYDAMAQEIERAGGTVEKFVGDAVMAAFGAPAAHEDHAERALHAALAMRRTLSDLFGDRLALRIGVNTGEVVVGRPREGSSFVTGDAVNVGARLEQAAAPGEILVGERTASAARGAFEFDDPTTVEAKGKPGGIRCRRLVRALSLMRPRGVGWLRRAFVGRQEELEHLRQTYARVVEDSEPHLVTIIGEAGVGKTRLVRELWAWLAEQEPQPLQRTGRCLSYGHGITYWPLAEVLREHFGILDDDPPETMASRLGDRPFLGLTLGLDATEGLHPLAARERMHDAWEEFVGELVTERPTVILIEDVHWAEDDLYELLEALVGQVPGPLLLLATARPELLARRPDWAAARRNKSGLMLEALAPEDAVHLLDELLGEELPPPLRDVVVGRAEGNPFFVEELLATLIDRGVLQRSNGQWNWTELPEGFQVPDTVQAVLAARIDLLPAAEKAALQAASVIGRVFWTGPVYELAGAADFALLEERDFVRRRAGSSMRGQREYAIKHALTREVAYESLPKAKRARLHAAFAEWLEGIADAGDEHASLLAHHYAAAVRREDVDLAWPGQEADVERLRHSAVEWSRAAAAAAIGRYEIDQGRMLLRGAVDLESDGTRQADLWFEIGHASALKYDGEGFTAAMEKAIELGGPLAEVYTELGFQTVQRAGMWMRRPDHALVNGWIERALELAPPESPFRVKALFARAQWNSDEGSAREAHELADRAGGAELLSYTLGALADCRLEAGDYEEACSLTQQRLGLLPAISDPDHVGHAYWLAADVLMGAARVADARRCANLLDEAVGSLTPHHNVHGVGRRILMESLSGAWEAVRQLASRAERATDANLATPCPLNVSSLLHCALAFAHAGDEAESLRLKVKAEGIGMEGYGFEFDPPRIRLAVVRNDLPTVRRLVEALDPDQLETWAYRARSALFDALVALDDRRRIEADAPEWMVPGTYVEPFAIRALGAARRDEALLRQAADLFEVIGLGWEAVQTRKLMAPGGEPPRISPRPSSS